MTRVENIVYNAAAGVRGRGDLLFSENTMDEPLILMIHGGSWMQFENSVMTKLAEFLVDLGAMVFNINYRLIGTDPWPACGEDCLAAADFAMNCGHEFFGLVDRRKISIIGASAGGHLALHTALKLPPELVKCVISLSGPTDLPLLKQQGFGDSRGENYWQRFTGKSDETEIDKILFDSSPVNMVTEKSPPILCVHSTRDKVVDISHSERMIEKAKAAGAKRAELFTFEGLDEGHALWEDNATRVPSQQLQKVLREFMYSL